MLTYCKEKAIIDRTNSFFRLDINGIDNAENGDRTWNDRGQEPGNQTVLDNFRTELEL